MSHLDVWKAEAADPTTPEERLTELLNLADRCANEDEKAVMLLLAINPNLSPDVWIEFTRRWDLFLALLTNEAIPFYLLQHKLLPFHVQVAWIGLAWRVLVQFIGSPSTDPEVGRRLVDWLGANDLLGSTRTMLKVHLDIGRWREWQRESLPQLQLARIVMEEFMRYSDPEATRITLDLAKKLLPLGLPPSPVWALFLDQGNG